jgi:hypothetical protein
LGDIWYSSDGLNWREFTAERQFSARLEPSLLRFAGSLWIAAGNSWPVRNDVWRITVAPPSQLVEVTSHASFSPRDTAEGAVFAGKMWLSNGYYHGNVVSRDLWGSSD